MEEERKLQQKWVLIKSHPKCKGNDSTCFFSRQGGAENVDLEKEEGFSCGILRR